MDNAWNKVYLLTQGSASETNDWLFFLPKLITGKIVIFKRIFTIMWYNDQLQMSAGVFCCSL